MHSRKSPKRGRGSTVKNPPIRFFLEIGKNGLHLIIPAVVCRRIIGTLLGAGGLAAIFRSFH